MEALSFFKPSNRYGDRLNQFDLLKLLALAAMIVDHLGYYLFPKISLLRAVGRLAFPIFLFLVGYSENWKLRNDLLIWAGLVVLAAALTHHSIFPLNILATIVAVRFAMSRLMERFKLNADFLVGVYCACLLAFFPFYWLDYSSIALLFALCGVLVRRYPGTRMTNSFVIAVTMLHLGLEWLSFSTFRAASRLVMTAMLLLSIFLMQRFSLEPVGKDTLPTPLRRMLQWAARNTLPIYGLHVIALMLAERFFFPDRLMIFRWL